MQQPSPKRGKTNKLRETKTKAQNFGKKNIIKQSFKSKNVYKAVGCVALYTYVCEEKQFRASLLLRHLLPTSFDANEEGYEA